MQEGFHSNVQTRRAEPSDASSIASVLHRSFIEHESTYTPEAFAATICTPGKIQERMNEGPVWIVLKNDVVVGTASVVPKEARLYIRGMAVDPGARGEKIGQRLLECAEKFAIENGCKELFLSTTPFLTRAIRLYEQYGFHRTGEKPDDLFGTPLFTMIKTLRGTTAQAQADRENAKPGENH